MFSLLDFLSELKQSGNIGVVSPENDFMAAKEQEEEVPEALLQVPTPSHTLLGVTVTHTISSFCISKTFQILFIYHS